MQVTISGKVTPANRQVWVNGLQASVETNGDWKVKGVELSSENMAIFEAVALPFDEAQDTAGPQLAVANSEVSPVEKALVSATYLQTNVILNASQPTYGVFKVHLTGAAGQSFIMQSSTNLIDWFPITTNLNSAATFDYEDNNVAKYGCRFFRIVPVN
jgi:hypothetical protein